MIYRVTRSASQPLCLLEPVDPPVNQVKKRFIYESKRADRGNDISKENPNFVAGAAGGRG
jgi:hypothetical protein